MSFTQAVPGMKPGSTIRNVVIGFLYLPFMPFWPFIAAYVVATNRGGAAQSLSAVPGVSKDGGVVAGVVIFFGMLVLFGLMGAVLPGSDTDTTDSDIDAVSTDEGIDDDATTDSDSADSTEGPADDTDTDDADSSDDSTSGETDDSTSDGTDESTDDSSGDGTSDDSDEPTGDRSDGSTSDSSDDSATGDSEQSTGDESDGSDDESRSADDSTEDDSPPPAPDGESYQFNGNGNDVTDHFATEGGLVTIEFEHDGDSNFQVQAVDGEGNTEFLVNEIGGYDGTVALNMAQNDWRLDVTADGDWSAHVEQPRFNEADIQGLPAEASGKHAAWFGPYEFDGSQEVTFEIVGDRQASVWLRTTDGRIVDLLHNEIGPYEGSALVTNSGYGLIVVDTDSAEWRIEISE